MPCTAPPQSGGPDIAVAQTRAHPDPRAPRESVRPGEAGRWGEGLAPWGSARRASRGQRRPGCASRGRRAAARMAAAAALASACVLALWWSGQSHWRLFGWWLSGSVRWSQSVPVLSHLTPCCWCSHLPPARARTMARRRGQLAGSWERRLLLAQRPDIRAAGPWLVAQGTRLLPHGRCSRLGRARRAR